MFELDKAARRVELDAKQRLDPEGGYTPAMLAYYSYLVDGTTSDIAERVLFTRLREDRTQANLAEALILSGCPPETVEETFRIPAKAFSWYRELFFDTDQFLTELDLISYLENCPKEDGKEMKVRAVDFGYEYILYTFGHVTPNEVARTKMLQNICASTAYKALSMNYHGMTSSAGKQATEYAKIMVKVFDTLQRMPAENSAGEDLVQFITKPQNQDNWNDTIHDGDLI